MSFSQPIKPHSIARVAAWLLVFAGISPLYAARPTAAQLLPQSTVAFARVTDARDLYDRFQQTGTGRMLQDPQLQPLIKQLYGSAAEAFDNADKELKLGMSLNELLSIPQGEISIGVVMQGRSQPDVVALVDVGDHVALAKKLLDRAAQFITQQGGAVVEEMVGDTKVTRFDLPDNGRIVHAEREGTIILSTNIDLVKAVFGRWDGKQEKSQLSLADNDNFNAIMKSCRPSQDEDVQIMWFVDPIAVVRMVGQSNPLVLLFLPRLGLDGLKGIGGTASFCVGEFTNVNHMHVLLEAPRKGVLELLALGAGDTTPESWVPADIINYITVHWEIEKTFQTLGKIVDSFQSEGTFARMVKGFSTDRLGIDLEKDLIPALAGRITYINRIEQPGRIDGQGTLVALKLKDPDKFAEVLAKVVARYENLLEKQSFGGSEYHVIKIPRPFQSQNEVNLPSPCFGIVGQYVMLTDRVSLLQKAISMSVDSTAPLADSLEYKLIGSKIGRLAGDAKPGMVMFQRPEEGFRFLYQLATSQQNRDRLKEGAGDNPLFKALNSALQDNPLPPFEVLAKYMAPGGGILVNDETGFHYTDFVLKRE